jgi:hypothetical protein
MMNVQVSIVQSNTFWIFSSEECRLLGYHAVWFL